MQGRAYLGRTMLARLLACLALVSGLTAAGVPANAAMMEAASQQIEADGQAAAGKSASCPCSDQRNVGKATDPSQAKCRTRKPVVIYIPTVQFGADRAYE